MPNPSVCSHGTSSLLFPPVYPQRLTVRWLDFIVSQLYTSLFTCTLIYTHFISQPQRWYNVSAYYHDQCEEYRSQCRITSFIDSIEWIHLPDWCVSNRAWLRASWNLTHGNLRTSGTTSTHELGPIGSE